MPKPPVRKPKKKVCAFCKENAPADRLQGHHPAAPVHLRPRQDPRPSGHRQLHAAPARHRDGGQERPRGRAAAVHLHRSLSRGSGRTRHEAHPHHRRARPGRPRRHRRGQGRLRPQLPAAAGQGHRRHQGRREAGRDDQAGPAGPGDPRHRTRQRGEAGAGEADRSPSPPAPPPTARSCSARSPTPTSRTPSRRPAARRSTSARNRHRRSHQDRRLAPGRRSSCTRASPPSSRSPSSRPDAGRSGQQFRTADAPPGSSGWGVRRRGVRVALPARGERSGDRPYDQQ